MPTLALLKIEQTILNGKHVECSLIRTSFVNPLYSLIII